MKKLPKDLAGRFVALVGKQQAITDKQDMARYDTENRGIFPGNAALVLKPKNTDEVSAILALASKTATPIVPQGGNTGHVAGGVASGDGSQIVVSLERMNKIRELDLKSNTLTVEAGTILEQVQKIADDNDRLFPLALGAQGSCQIGGNIATNAGGTGVLSYGNMRNQVLGLEVVMPDGQIWNGLRKLKKDNTGYDLRDLFIGAEGTLGIVTAAVLKLQPKPKAKEIAFAAMKTPQKALEFFAAARAIGGTELTAFELMPAIGIKFIGKHFPEQKLPFAAPHPWLVMFEISSLRSAEDARMQIEAILSSALEKNTIDDAVIAGSIAQQREFWGVREHLPLSQRPEGVSFAHDISVPIEKIPELIKTGEKRVKKILPDIRMVAFGHMGDGNIHFNFSQPEAMDRETFLPFRPAVNKEVFDLVLKLGGSISAEHGIGALKRDLMAKTKSPVEMALMRAIKNALDPKGIMNPGKVVE